MRARIKATWAMLAAAARMGIGCASPEPAARVAESSVTDATERSAPSGARFGIAYGSDFAQKLDVYPAPAQGAPLLVFVHGGAWIGGNRLIGRSAAREFVQAGFAAALVDYRLSPSVRHPAHAQDVAAALGWLSLHAKEFGYDPKRIVVIGHSAGAHIAGVIATTAALDKTARHPCAFVGLQGIYDLPTLVKVWPSYRSAFLAMAFGQDEKKWGSASPTRRGVASRAPWLVVHLRGDGLVDVPQSDAFSKHLRAAGVRVTDLRPAGGSHDAAVAALAQQDDPIFRAIAQLARSPGLR